MKCVIRDNLDKRGLSIRGLAEQADQVPGAPSYSTIDNFIRKGTGNLDTAWAITKLMGVTLNDNFIDEENDFGTLKTTDTGSLDTEAALNTIITDICKIGKIEKPNDVAKILFIIGKSITPLGYGEEAGSIIKMGTDYIKMMDMQGGNGDE